MIINSDLVNATSWYPTYNHTNSPSAEHHSSWGAFTSNNAMYRSNGTNYISQLGYAGSWVQTSYFTSNNEVENWYKQILPANNQTIYNVNVLARCWSSDIPLYQVNITLAYSIDNGVTWGNSSLILTNGTPRCYQFDITHNESWNASILKSSNMTVRITAQTSTLFLDYIGLNYTWGFNKCSYYLHDVFAPTAWFEVNDYSLGISNNYSDIYYGIDDYTKLDGNSICIRTGCIGAIDYTSDSFAHYWKPWASRNDWPIDFHSNGYESGYFHVGVLIVACVPLTKSIQVNAVVTALNVTYEYNTNYWNTTPIGYINYTDGLYHAYDFDITNYSIKWTGEIFKHMTTDLYDFSNPNLGTYNNIMVYVSINDNNMPVYIDYIGLHYIWYEPPRGGSGGGNNSNNGGGLVFYGYRFTKNIMSMVYLILLFSPAIILGEFVPKIGFPIGLMLMLTIIDVTSISYNFIGFMLIGWLTLGVMYYKGVL